MAMSFGRAEKVMGATLAAFTLLFVGGTGCSKKEQAAAPTAAPVNETVVPGGKLVVPANLPPDQQEQIRKQQMETLERNRQNAPPPQVTGKANP